MSDVPNANPPPSQNELKERFQAAMFRAHAALQSCFVYGDKFELDEAGLAKLELSLVRASCAAETARDVLRLMNGAQSIAEEAAELDFEPIADPFLTPNGAVKATEGGEA